MTEAWIRETFKGRIAFSVDGKDAVVLSAYPNGTLKEGCHIETMLALFAGVSDNPTHAELSATQFVGKDATGQTVTRSATEAGWQRHFDSWKADGLIP